MAEKRSKPVPLPYQDTQPYWDAAKEKRLILQRCLDCGKPQFYPRGVCSHCLGSQLEWIDSSGRGKVHTFTVSYRAPHPGFADDLPFVIAIIELEEGVRMMSNIVGCDPKTVRIDMPVKVVFEQLTPDIVLPKFAPA
jgi:uncharacterized OB-fold protein